MNYDIVDKQELYTMQLDNIEILYEYDENYQIPIKSDQKIGAVLICCKNKTIRGSKKQVKQGLILV